MNFYHYRPSCKVIKRSRTCKGPFFTNYSDDIISRILSFPETNLSKGKVNLNAIGIPFEYSRKVFIGGLPKDVTEEEIIKTFSYFGPMSVDWPYKKERNAVAPKEGYAFLLFESNEAVKSLIKSCEKKNDGYYKTLSLYRKKKVVQVKPWEVSATDYIFSTVSELERRNTVFVGGVDRTVTAKQLGIIMAEHFGDVLYVGIDTDTEFFYPKGAARVTFKNRESLIAAVKKRFLMISETKTTKMMEIKPYVLDDQICDKCNGLDVEKQTASLYCPEVTCLSYFCEVCWPIEHSYDESFQRHKPFVKQGLEDYNNSLRRRGFS